MPKLRSDNDGTILNPFLHCPHKLNKPRLHYKICEERCASKKDCMAYINFLKKQKGGEEEVPKPKRRIVRRRRKSTKKAAKK